MTTKAGKTERKGAGEKGGKTDALLAAAREVGRGKGSVSLVFSFDAKQMRRIQALGGDEGLRALISALVGEQFKTARPRIEDDIRERVGVEQAALDRTAQ